MGSNPTSTATPHELQPDAAAMTAITASVDVAVSADRAWAAITDWVGQGSWMPLTTVEVESGDGALGTRLLARQSSPSWAVRTGVGTGRDRSRLRDRQTSAGVSNITT